MTRFLLLFCVSNCLAFSALAQLRGTALPVIINIADFEANMVKVNDTLYASKYEVTNADYLLFLKQNTPEKKTRLSDSLQIDSTCWTKYLQNMEGMKNYHRHSAFQGYPVVGIYHRAAEEYCKWLTQQYNNAPNRKYPKVVFRLPSELEWEYAAKAGNKDRLYAWEGVEIMDKKGNFFCNFQDLKYALTAHKQKSQNVASDHYITTAPVKSYKPNQFGIFNMSGNVAEMTLEKGYSKGGGWYSEREKVEISQFEMYKNREPFVGFRVFMEVQ